MKHSEIDAHSPVSPPSDELQKFVFHYLSDDSTSAYHGNQKQPSTGSVLQNRVSTTKTGITVKATHCAYLFISESIVYKIKRIVNFSYLNTTTLESRHRLCVRELELNQPLLPDIYRDVVAITQEQDSTLTVNGRGPVVEWALRMNRFDEACVLENVAKSGRLSNQLADRMGESIATFHASRNSLNEEDGYQRMAEIVRELILEFSQLTSIIPRQKLREFEELISQALSKIQEKLDHRALDGFIKRCHGDLHLRNIVLHKESPVPFDALEFSERLATCDVLYDVAFLIMDIGNHALYEQQNHLLNSYLLHTDIDNLKSLDILMFFLSCRAAIKAMTTAQSIRFSNSDDEKKAQEASHYLQSALDYLIPTKPVLVAIGGLSGSGKSTVSQYLAPRIAQPPGAILLQSDAERKIAAGVSSSHALPRDHYTEASSVQNYSRLLSRAEAALSSGSTVIVDATFLGVQDRQDFEKMAQEQDVPFIGMWLCAGVTVVKSRITSRTHSISDATVDVFEHQLQANVTTPSDWIPIDTNGKLEDTLSDCLNNIRPLLP